MAQAGTRRLPNGRMHGMGFTWTHEWEDSSGTSEMAIRIERNDGTANILAIRADVGVNAETAYCQIVADEIGMRIEDVFYRPHEYPGFVAMTPDSSTNLCINGFAVRHAARRLKQRILDVATQPTGRTQRGSFPARFAGYKPEDLDIKESVIFVKTDPSINMTIGTLVGADGLEGSFDLPARDGQGGGEGPILRSPSSRTATTCSRALTPMRGCGSAGRPTSWRSRWTRRQGRSS